MGNGVQLASPHQAGLLQSPRGRPQPSGLHRSEAQHPGLRAPAGLWPAGQEAREGGRREDGGGARVIAVQ